MEHDWFSPINFEDLYNKSVSTVKFFMKLYSNSQIPPPWVPGDTTEDSGDFRHFADFIENDLDIDFGAFDQIDSTEELPEVFKDLQDSLTFILPHPKRTVTAIITFNISRTRLLKQNIKKLHNTTNKVRQFNKPHEISFATFNACENEKSYLVRGQPLNGLVSTLKFI